MTPSQLLYLLSSDVLLASNAFASSLMTAALEVNAKETDFEKRIRSEFSCKPIMEPGGIAVVTISGALAHNPEAWEMYFCGVEDSSTVTSAILQCANDPSVKGILLDINSPGGTFTGGPEMTDAVDAATKSKPVVAWTGGMMASLAYMLAAPSTEIISSKSAQVGSIGAYTTVLDVSDMFKSLGLKMEVFTNTDGTLKTAGLPGTSLTDAQREHIKAGVNSVYSIFADTVTTNRPDIKPESMKGQSFIGIEAQKAGLVDRVGSREFAMGILRQLASSQK